MTLTLLNLYNTAASQEWAMYDNDALSEDEFEDSLVLAINKAILEIYTSYDFPFRERTHLILTMPGIDSYELPQGLIKKDKKGNHLVKYNSTNLDYIEYTCNLLPKTGIPNAFYIKNNNIVFYPVPEEKGLVTIDYTSMFIGENANGEEIYSLKNESDKLLVPEYLEELMKEAIITKAMLNTIASESDENFSAYRKQANKAYKQLIKYSKGVRKDKVIKF